MNIFIIVIIRRLSFMVINCRINPPLSLFEVQPIIHSLTHMFVYITKCFPMIGSFRLFLKKISAERKGKGNIGALTPSTLKNPCIW